jgi:signal transduction histidine kinase
MRQDGRMANAFGPRLRLLLWSGAATGLAVVCLVLFVVVITGVALTTVWVGVPMVLLGAYFVRPVADLHRRMIGKVDGQPPIESPYLTPATGNMLVRFRALFRDPARWRDAWWLLLNGTVGLFFAIIGIAEGILDLIFWWLPPALAIRVHTSLNRSLLSVSEKSRLALRVEQLTESRAETVDTQAAEVRRIERDLHDGAQARLVAIGMTLGLAEEQMSRDPEAARALLAEARGTAGDALAELRHLVRGIHPPVLADRGLVEAVRALAQAVPMPVRVSERKVPDRLPDPVESAAYFGVAEAIANAIKHSSAKAVTVDLRYDRGVLTVAVMDDGAGGADPARGSGLRGIGRRLAAFDGTLAVVSPTGGPTTVTMVLPCGSSSPKILPSSGTG